MHCRIPFRLAFLSELGISLFLLAIAALAASGAPAAQKPKLPKPTVLDRGTTFERDAESGEMSFRPTSAAGAGTQQPPAVIRSRVSLVQVGCSVTAADGTQVRGLTQNDFRVLEDGVAQKIDSFDAASTPASIALVIDASPSIYRELGQMRDAARSLSQSLNAQDEVAVVAFSDQAHLLLPFSRDRELLGAALASGELTRVANSTQSFIYRAVYLTARQLFADRPGRKAIVLLTDGQDSGLGLTWDPATMQPRPGAASVLAFSDVVKELAFEGIEMYVISTENRPPAMTEAWLASHRQEVLVSPASRKLEMPHYTLYLADLVRQAGGNLYFLRELGSLAEVYRQIALKLSAEYVLGYYPDSGVTTPGWHSLDVQLISQNPALRGVRVTHRNSYFVPASP